MTLSERDQRVIWHPYTQHKMSPLAHTIVSGKGAYFFDEKGQPILDLISAWWATIHGHSHPEIAEAIYQQALKLEHINFANFTHEPAVQLAEEILALLPAHFSKVFYSDNGSTAVEVALKMAYQYWRNQGDLKRQRFIAFDKGYHGDTCGAMAMGRQSGFFSHYEALFFQADFFPYPATWMGDQSVQQKEHQALAQLEDYLKKHGEETAALMIEPLIQGASGMNMCRPEFLQALEKLIKPYGVLIIYDEVMTGFGRTGDYFACVKANTAPDIICLAKGLTGGFLPGAATICGEHIYQTFLGDDFSSALAHGHTFTANPLCCAAGLASLAILQRPETQAQIAMIEATHRTLLKKLSEEIEVDSPRYCGTVAAFDLKISAEYGSTTAVKLREQFYKQGLLIRPLGNTIYFLPPYCISETDLKRAYTIVAQEIEGVIA